jgi:hypothetical protein
VVDAGHLHNMVDVIDQSAKRNRWQADAQLVLLRTSSTSKHKAAFSWLRSLRRYFEGYDSG